MLPKGPYRADTVGSMLRTKALKEAREKHEKKAISDSDLTAIEDREITVLVKRLESIGADFLIMPCNTAHNYYEQVCEAVTIPVLHMIALTRDALKERGVKCAGLLATDGTVQTGIYQRTFEQSGVALLTPDSAADQAFQAWSGDEGTADGPAQA